MAIGTFLMSFGIHLILDSLRSPEVVRTGFSIVHFFNRFVSQTSHAVIITVTIALMIGYFKGKMVLAKSVKRQIKRVDSLPNPASLRHLFSKAYYLLIASMILLGISLRYLPIHSATRGFVDLAIGSALINGAMLYFREIAQRIYLARRGTHSR